MAIDHLDVLASWGQQQTEREAALLQLVGAAILSKLGETVITISPADLAELHQNFEVISNVSAEGMTIRLRPRNNFEPELPLER